MLTGNFEIYHLKFAFSFILDNHILKNDQYDVVGINLQMLIFVVNVSG